MATAINGTTHRIPSGDIPLVFPQISKTEEIIYLQKFKVEKNPIIK